MAAAAQQMNPLQQNMMARARLLQTGIPMVKRIAPITGVALGAAVKVPLLRMGIMTGVLLQITVPMNITVLGVPSPVGPWNFLQGVKYTDFAGVDRVRTNGFQLWAAQSMKQLDALGAAPKMDGAGGVVPLMNYNTNILRQDTAVNAAASMQFSIYVPMAYDPATDLTGAVLTQTNVGEHYITLQLANALVNADPWVAPYTAGTAALLAAGVTIEAFQHYIQPQALTADALPIIDLSTIYGFEGSYATTQGIAANQSSFINYPNNRSILSTLINYENNSAFTLNETDVSLITLLANSNTNLREMTPRYIREMMRHILGRDLPSGSYYIGSRRQPIMTQLYANVQAKIDVAANGGGVSQFVSQFEVQYPSGSPLPGITG